MIAGALAWIAGAWASKIGRAAISALGLLLLLAWFYSWAADKGRTECELRVLRESEEVRQQVREELQRVIDEATARAIAAEELNEELERRVEDVIEEARRTLEGDSVCLPSDITDRLRDLR